MRIRVYPLFLLLTTACGGDPPDPADPTGAVVKQYAVLMHANSSDVVDQLQALKSAVADFVANPRRSTTTTFSCTTAVHAARRSDPLARG